MLDGGIIERLLEEKWKTFARNQFLKRLLILFVHLFFLSCSVYTRPSRLKLKESEEESGSDGDEVKGLEHVLDATTITRYCCECATVAGVISFVVFQQGLLQRIW